VGNVDTRGNSFFLISKSKKKNSKIIQTMDGVPSLCVCSTRHIAPQMGLDRQRQRQITKTLKRFNSKQRHSCSVRYMENKQSEVTQDG